MKFKLELLLNFTLNSILKRRSVVEVEGVQSEREEKRKREERREKRREERREERERERFAREIIIFARNTFRNLALLIRKPLYEYVLYYIFIDGEVS